MISRVPKTQSPAKIPGCPRLSRYGREGPSVPQPGCRYVTTKPLPWPRRKAVEFFFPSDALRCYEAYDCTGQQLIDQGSVLINGERVSLDLQMAEASEP